MTLMIGRWALMAGKGLGGSTSVHRGRCSHDTASKFGVRLRGYFVTVVLRDKNHGL